MTVQDFARQIVDSKEYRATIVARAAAGTLSEELEILLWDLAANRVPLTPPQSRTLALIRPAEELS